MSFSNTNYLYTHLPARFRREDKDLFLKRYLQWFGGADVDVSTEKTVEQSSEQSSGDLKSDEAAKPETNVNVKVENNLPSAEVHQQRDPNKNYEAAQPIVDPVV